MKPALKYLFILMAFATLQSCTDNSIIDNFVTIPNQHWTYAQPSRSVVEITNTAKKYNILINLRHTDAYKYANIWVKVTILNPDKTRKTERIAFTIATQEGAWLGTTSGNLFTYQLPYKENYQFKQKGKYVFVIEQNMRDNPLDGVNDVGLRVEEVQ